MVDMGRASRCRKCRAGMLCDERWRSKEGQVCPGRQSANKNGGEEGILPQSPNYIERIGLIEVGRRFSDTLDDTPDNIRSQEPMTAMMPRNAEIISALR